MLELVDFAVDYPGRPGVVRAVEACWQPGEVIGLLGPNGSGKSTLLKAMAGLTEYRGQLLWRGQDVSTWSPSRRARHLSYMPQQVQFQQPFSGREVVMMGVFSRLNRWGQASQAERERVDQCLERVGAGHLGERPVTAMSGGEVQRIRLAQALAQDAEAWLLDEPTSALDLHQQLEVVELFGQLQAEGRSLLLVLHDLNLARQLCSHWWVIHNGHLCLQGKPDVLFEQDAFQRIFQVKMEVFQNSSGESIWRPRKIDSSGCI
jgi:iron complex transport system ATP-binding protein